MIADLRSYPTYRDSGVPWLGQVPGHWNVERLKARATNIVEQTAASQSDALYVALEHVESWTGQLRDAGADVTLDGQVKRFRAGDVLFGKLRPYLAKVTRPKRDGICVGEFFVLRSQGPGVSAPYLEYLLRSKPIIDAINSSTFGAKMPRADWQFVGSIKLSFPPFPEQSAIVRFLDHADRRVRRYIRAKKKLIALLNEQREAIIRRAVTRGLDPNIRFKPSGMKWLGDVPEHWDVRPAKSLFREVDERSAAGTEELLSVSHLTGVTPRSQKNITMFMASSYVGHKVCRPGDLVINTMWAWMGALGVARQTGLVSPAYGVYRPLSPLRLLADYADMLFRTGPYVSEYVCRSTGIRSSRLRLYPEQFLRIGLACPPIKEQEAILQWVATETTAIGHTMSGAQRGIDLLREYRTRLTADVVTGKLDVREATARLPIEAEEPLGLDETDALSQVDETDFDAAISAEEVDA